MNVLSLPRVERFMNSSLYREGVLKPSLMFTTFTLLLIKIVHGRHNHPTLQSIVTGLGIRTFFLPLGEAWMRTSLYSFLLLLRCINDLLMVRSLAANPVTDGDQLGSVSHAHHAH